MESVCVTFVVGRIINKYKTHSVWFNYQMIYLYTKQANRVLPSVIEGRARKNLHATPISSSNQIQNIINLINLDLPMP